MKHMHACQAWIRSKQELEMIDQKANKKTSTEKHLLESINLNVGEIIVMVCTPINRKLWMNKV